MHSVVAPEYKYLRLQSAIASFELNWLQLDDVQRQACEQMTERALTLQQAVNGAPQAVRVKVEPGEVNAALAQLRSRYEDEQQFADALSQNELDEDSLKQALQSELRCEAVLASLANEVPQLTEFEALNYYQRHLDKFQQPERRRGAHLLITINPKFPENSESEAYKRITALHTEARLENFGDLALRHSECPTAMQGGELGMVEQGQLFPELDSELFSMSAGTISAPVKSEIGFHLLYCMAISPAHTVSFEQAKQSIIEQHHQRALKTYQKQWLKALTSAG